MENITEEEQVLLDLWAGNAIAMELYYKQDGTHCVTGCYLVAEALLEERRKRYNK